MRRIREILSILLVALTAMQAVAADFTEDVEQFVEASGVPEGSLAVYIAALDAKKPLAAYNIETPLVPASIMKVVTIATLLEKTGPDWRYRTGVYLTAPVRDGAVEGDLVVVGSGDPSINSDPEPHSADLVAEIVDALTGKKVQRIEGRIVVDDALMEGPSTPPTWASGDLPHAYGTGSHAFNFRNNSTGKSAVKNPASVFESALRAALARAGIEIGERSLPQGERRLLLEHESAPIDEIMRSCMMRSDNLFAECMLRTYALLRGKNGSTAEGARLETEYWKKKHLPMEGINIVDGSGLSRSDRMTAQFMADVLERMADNVVYASFFPLAGQEGTLRKFLAGTPLDSYIALKTGSMNGIQCYAGYKLDDDYAPTHVVVVMANNMKDRARLRSALQTLLLKIFD